MLGLSVTEVSICDFRSYSSFNEELDPGLTIVVGPNAAGKTNLIEAIQVLTSGESFRRPSWPDLIKWGEKETSLSLSAEGEGRHLSIQVGVSGGKKTTTINGKVKRRRAEITGILPCVIFTPDHLRMVKDSAEARRAALDGIGIQLSPSYARMKADYERILKHRNRLLKEGSTGEDLSLWTTRLVEVGVPFIEARKRLFLRILGPLAEMHAEISPSTRLTAEYLPFWERDGLAGKEDVTASFTEHLRAKASVESKRGMTLSGPHRDDVDFMIGGKSARSFASQGQQRTIALSWKLAEVMVTEQISGQTPILLLDDVMSELDDERRRALTSRVGILAQTIVTTTNIGYFEEDLIGRAKVIRLG